MPKPTGGGGGKGGGSGPAFAVTGLTGTEPYLAGTGDPNLVGGIPDRIITVEVDDGTTIWSGTAEWYFDGTTWTWRILLSDLKNEADSTDSFDDETGSFTVIASYEEYNKKGNLKGVRSTDPYALDIVGSGNADPVADDDVASTDEDTAVVIDVLTGDTDPEGDPLSVTAATDGANGTTSVNPDGTITYTPNANWSGTDTFTYDISDGNGGTDSATVTVTVDPVNDDPTAANDTISTAEDTPVAISVLANDTDPENDPLSVTAATDGANGTTSVNPDGTITYTPDAGWSGTDTFTYDISDGNGGSDTATVTVTVDPVNDIPVAVDDSYVTDEDTAVRINFTANDFDPDGDFFGVAQIESLSGEGSLEQILDGTGDWLFTPGAHFNGTATFRYNLTDGTVIGETLVVSDWATVTIIVNPVEDAPVAAADTAITDYATPIDIDVLANDFDPEGVALTLVGVTGPAGGAVSINPDGTVHFVPDAGFEGDYSFSYDVSDGALISTGSATVTVLPEVDVTPPAVSAPDLAAISDTGDADDDNLTNDTTPTFTGTAEAGATVELFDGATKIGETTADGAGTWEVTVGPLAAGTRSITAQATDASNNTSALTAPLVVTIDTATDTPSITEVLSETGTPAPGNITDDATPTLRGAAEAGALVTVSIDGVVQGTTRANGSGLWAWTVPAAAALADGSYEFTVSAEDIAGNAPAGSAAFTVEVDAVPDTPPPPGPGDPPLTSYTPDDPLYTSQWHFAALGDIETIWGEYTGVNVSVAISDNGIEAGHWDLAASYDATKAVYWNGVELNAGPADHGTLVAGLIAAADNDLGGIGIAFDAGITSVQVVGGVADGEGDPAGFDYAMHELANFDVVNMSWGEATDLYLNAANSYTLSTIAAAAFATGIGRNGLGTIFLKSAGNNNDGSQHDAMNNTRHISVIGAFDEDMDVAWYSNRGANLLVVAPSAGNDSANDARIVTTDLTGSGGLAGGDYTDVSNGFNGTSAAAPMVSGVVALMLDANAFLGWRDVQEILAASARRIETSDPQNLEHGVYFGNDILLEKFSWFHNGDDDWNGGGKHYSEDYGFGAVDVFAATRMAEVWSWFGEAETSLNELSHAVATYNDPNAYDNSRGNVPGATESWSHQTVTAGMELEYVTVHIDMFSNDLSRVNVDLRSPEGTWVSLLKGADVSRQFIPPDYVEAFSGTGQAFWSLFAVRTTLDWTFAVRAFDGETSDGQWSLRISDGVEEVAGDYAQVNSWKLDFWGEAPSSDDTYTYTMEMLDPVYSGDAGRVNLDDAGGTDWLNFAAMTADMDVDLNPGASSTADAGAGPVTVVTLDQGTAIENAVTGDGDDVITGNGQGNILAGMRGNDQIHGGGGDDVLFGHQGDDQLWGDAGIDTFWFESWDGDDTIMDFELGLDVVGLSFIEGVTGLGDLVFQDSGTDQVMFLATGDTITFVGGAGWDLAADIEINGPTVLL